MGTMMAVGFSALAAAFGLAGASVCERAAARLLAMRGVQAASNGASGRSGMRARVWRVLCAVLIGTAAGAYVWWLGFAPEAVPDALWAVAGTAVALVIAACDLRARIIPWECCACLAAMGCAFGLATGRIGSLAWSLLGALGAWAAMASVSRVAGGQGEEAIGQGDVRAVPACVLFLGVGQAARASPVAAGLAVSSAACCTFVLAALAAGRLGLHDRIPFGPFFSGWLYTGVLSPPVLAALA